MRFVPLLKRWLAIMIWLALFFSAVGRGRRTALTVMLMWPCCYTVAPASLSQQNWLWMILLMTCFWKLAFASNRSRSGKKNGNTRKRILIRACCATSSKREFGYEGSRAIGEGYSSSFICQTAARHRGY